ncbi:hypothetical protein G6F47_013791 [Rhizopus delemar]|uniref:Uncharacterized protein n=1 Tax=Rhizopus oryzae TaxID=64495 RepID=A0A9P6XMY2_RHIOR|nr:hypothetical protein G6F54_014019 [Rhizopus delemar]KAG1526186.1 hypothetical protein G6F51_014339 [Rhizopus arrhizus]KAG1484358.1 hypothetical protein G6F53_014030 [Rhizopus delemar]KAG1530049.1 hypothetical protein G6F49_013867 [Rhizopus delemar]KAG1565613.1 hypothetical protein G6F48_013790 [Rhizopus delemar]
MDSLQQFFDLLYVQCTIAKHGPTKAIQNLKAGDDLEDVGGRSNEELDFDLLYLPVPLHHIFAEDAI